MHCKSLWIKASAKCINVKCNVNISDSQVIHLNPLTAVVQFIARWRRSYHVTLEDLKNSVQVIWATLKVLFVWSILELNPIKPTVSCLIFRYLRPLNYQWSKRTQCTTWPLSSVRKLSLVYITSYQHFIVLFANINISNCTKLHILLILGLWRELRCWIWALLWESIINDSYMDQTDHILTFSSSSVTSSLEGMIFYKYWLF